jgi:hypothetical protein
MNNPAEARALGVPDGVTTAWVFVDCSVALEKCKQALRDHNEAVPSSPEFGTSPDVASSGMVSALASALQANALRNEAAAMTLLMRKQDTERQAANYQQLSSLMQLQQQGLPQPTIHGSLLLSQLANLGSPSRESLLMQQLCQSAILNSAHADPTTILTGSLWPDINYDAGHLAGQCDRLYNAGSALVGHPRPRQNLAMYGALGMPVLRNYPNSSPPLVHDAAANADAAFSHPSSSQRQRLFSEMDMVAMASYNSPDHTKKRRTEQSAGTPRQEHHSDSETGNRDRGGGDKDDRKPPARDSL